VRLVGWSSVGLLFAFGLFTQLFWLLWPIAFVLAAGLLLSGNTRKDHIALAVLLALGLTCLVLATLNLDYQSCNESGATGSSYIRGGASKQADYQCGGLNPIPWALVGLIALGAGGFGLLRTRRAV
jgi:hypothetical protein